MARISGVELPSNQKVLYALPVIYGVGFTLAKKIIEAAKIPIDKKTNDLKEEEVLRLQKEVEKYPVEGELRRLVSQNIRRLEDISSYRGLRHRRGLPVRGQRTRSNARTKRGNRQTVGAIKKDMKAVAAKSESNEKGAS
ncbi:MAG: 30S ribosomal protein S13 [Candidatus Woykebacteria bacterium RBG_13_40_15]|uniref:Small ribosomal subunit protein uS13 n=1 Tax=Candidatus Woykebacteria bacterium RBG_13_40_15 TaxID=1802593 RepID=A0A1G1W956_9BACT|nr:MAG: 30S ribosomal protein S13 [Candidatus Woykebacteria bacterium RBG_13_40_15]